jgi:hypothetical protein
VCNLAPNHQVITICLAMVWMDAYGRKTLLIGGTLVMAVGVVVM